MTDFSAGFKDPKCIAPVGLILVLVNAELIMKADGLSISDLQTPFIFLMNLDQDYNQIVHH